MDFCLLVAAQFVHVTSVLRRYGLQALDVIDPFSALLDPDYGKWQSVDEIKKEFSPEWGECHSSVLRC